jgi:hypothetical protein
LWGATPQVAAFESRAPYTDKYDNLLVRFTTIELRLGRTSCLSGRTVIQDVWLWWGKGDASAQIREKPLAFGTL